MADPARKLLEALERADALSLGMNRQRIYRRSALRLIREALRLKHKQGGEFVLWVKQHETENCPHCSGCPTHGKRRG